MESFCEDCTPSFRSRTAELLHRVKLIETERQVEDSLVEFSICRFFSMGHVRGMLLLYLIAYMEGAHNLHFVQLMLISRLIGSIQIPIYADLLEMVNC